MASCETAGDGNVRPQVRLDVSQSSSTDSTVTLSWTLKWITYGYTCSTNGNGRAWSVTIDGTQVRSGSLDINGLTSTTIASGTTTVSKSHSSRNVSFSLSFAMNVTWSGVYCGTMTASGSIGIGAKTSYTVSYNANGGSGAPSSQTKWYDETLTLSSTVPTKSGYTFLGWATSSSATSATYSAGGSYTSNSAATLYAIWKKTITITYNANGGSGAPSSQSANVYNATTSYTFTLSSTKPTRTGYTFLGWSTSSSATSSSYSSGSSYSFSSSTTLYAVWTENYLTINYYSNYATSAFDGALNSVGADKNVIVSTSKYYYDNDYSTYGLANYSTSSGSVYMTRTRYDATGYWCTTTAEDIKLEGNKADVITYNGGIAIGEDKGFATGQAIAQALGLSLASGNKSINLYANWVLLCSRIYVYLEDGTVVRGLCHFYNDSGEKHYAIITVYDENGNAREVI